MATKGEIAATIDVTIPVDAEVAELLADPRNQKAIGHVISRLLRRHPDPRRLARAIAQLKAAARAAGLSDSEIDAELAADHTKPRDRDGTA